MKNKSITIGQIYNAIAKQYKSKKIVKKNKPIIIMVLFHTFPDILGELNTYFLGATNYLNSTPHLAVDPAKLIVLNGLITGSVNAWDVIYPASVGDNSSHNYRTKRHILIGKIEICLLDIYDNIPKDLWTVDDRSALRRPEKATTHTHSTAYGNAPTIETYSIQHLGISLKLLNPATPASQEVPVKQHMILEWFIGPAGLADADIKWDNSKSVSHFLDTEHYTDGQVGLTAYFHVCYESTRHERSVFSAVHKVTIS